jgi:hypothetical protein
MVTVNTALSPLEPKSLKNEENRVIRRELLSSQHMQPLTEWVANLRKQLDDSFFVPDFDPLDGGINAEFLFLFEKPGPKTDSRNGGSGFISRDNNDPTAENILRFMNDIGLNRNRTLIWNIMPIWDKTIKFNSQDRKKGARLLEEVMELLPNIKALILVGNSAQSSEKWLKIKNGIRVIKSAHPGAKVKARYRDKWNDIPRQWEKVFSGPTYIQ